MLTKADWQDWLEMPQTKALQKAIRDEIDLTLSIVVNQVDMDSLKQARFIGVMSGLNKVLNFEYDDGQPQ